ncbi:hypothetical protein CQA49_03100 [Helicobacter sp. MIT 00-7814]|uniref:hypothetical protein n=1 Tax=unclassified Helicobacter TaxID=2593540 RepID=UPI000E1ED537|nr:MULTISPECIES: hypothetical protein [unclassified Helicobacter]RDU55898.1 hypothetical protein CQA49_03100 [Helicobacter sp. MIT 00-7814]RDU56856.1 hypothetical protein CQA37_01795 [Helicobacter sp. MIT 99-10781]
MKLSQKLQPREKLLLFICLIFITFFLSFSFVINPLRAQLRDSQMLHHQLLQDTKDGLDFELSQSANLSATQENLNNLISANAILHALMSQIAHVGIFENLDSVLVFMQDLQIYEIKLSDDGLHIITLRGSGEFARVMEFINKLESLRPQFISLDFLHLESADEGNITFETLLQDMRLPQ